MTVLIIEDDPYINELLQTLLAEEGHQTVPAYDGKEGLELARAVRPSLITLDLALPVLNGRQVLETLKSDEATRDIPVIVVSAQTEELARGDRQLATRVVEKPFDLTRLVEVVSQVGGTA